MWSQCVWLIRTWPLMGFSDAASAWPRANDPVPMSSTMSVPCDDLTAVQEVLPPYLTVSGPGTGMDPRVPKNVTSMALPASGHNSLTPWRHHCIRIVPTSLMQGEILASPSPCNGLAERSQRALTPGGDGFQWKLVANVNE